MLSNEELERIIKGRKIKKGLILNRNGKKNHLKRQRNKEKYYIE